MGVTYMTDTTLAQTIQSFSDQFESKTRGDSEIVTLKDDCSEELRESVRSAHDGRLPNDWIYATYASLMQKLTEYEIENMDDIEEFRGEIVDSEVDFSDYKLFQWLADNNQEYVNEAVQEFGIESKDFDITKIVKMGQYKHIDNIYSSIVNLLSE